MSTVHHSHVCEVNCFHPSRSSRRYESRSAASRGAIRMRASSAAQTKKVRLSTASAQPGSTATTRTPPTAGPAILTMPRDSPCSALACCRRARLTVCGTSPTSAGTTRPSPRPHSAPSSAKDRTVASP